jgi:BirA family biotin operon repressor/biotin-[acetyl-CoA-carboxylase] ligase
VTPGDRATDSAHDGDAMPSAAVLGLVQVVHEQQVESTMDEAHALADKGAPAGVLVVADRQLRGRGRSGREWESANGAGLWMTLLERPDDPRIVGVLALRLGLALADALAPFVDAPVSLKWPNDLYVAKGKLAGILVEARWRESVVDWVAIGVGINRRVPAGFPDAAAIRAGVSRADLLMAIIPRLRLAASTHGHLSDAECTAWAERDLARGRRVREPGIGVVQGIAPDGALLVHSPASGRVEPYYAGSLVFDESHAT